LLALFRNNRATTSILLLLYVILTRLPGLLGYVQPDATEVPPGSMSYRFLFGWLSEHPQWSVISATVLAYGQALWINFLADRHKLLSERNWLPGVFYTLITAFLPEFLYLSPPLVAASFIPAALYYIFKSYKVVEVRNWIFDTAVWLTVSSIFYPPAFVLLLAGFIGLLFVRSFKFKERMVYLTGILVSFFLIWLFYYWGNNGVAFWRGQLAGFSGWYRFTPEWNFRTIVEIILVVILILTLSLSYFSYTNRKLIQVRNYVHVLYAFLIIAGAAMMLQGDFYNTHLLLLMPSAGIFLSMTFADIRRTSFAELLHLFLLLVAFLMQTL
jgi:hypothetical protein